MIKINLIPAEERRDIKGFGELLLGLLVIVALFAGIAALHVVQSNNMKEVETKFQKTEKEIKSLEAVKIRVDEFKAKNLELKRRIEIINTLERNRTGPLFVMDALASAMPAKAWIDEFSESGMKAKMVGIADNEFTVADLMESLQASPYFKTVELGVIKKTTMRKQQLRSFALHSRLDYTGGKNFLAAASSS